MFNIIEICTKDDSRVDYLIEQNQVLGNAVYLVKDKYYVTLLHETVWRSKEVEYNLVPNGTYLFRNDVVYLLQ